MTISDELMMGGLTPEHELLFTQCPADPAMRESTSVWLYEENGGFAFPRFGIEAEAHAWDNQMVQGNFTLPGGRVLDGFCVAKPHSPFDAEGRPTVMGAGPVSFRCIEPFRKWHVRWDGPAIDGTIEQQIAGKLDPANLTAAKYEAELTMATPCWVHNYPPELVAAMSPNQQAEAGQMGIGWRLEHLFRAEGTFTIDGQTRAFKGLGSRIKRQSVRPTVPPRGHCWQSALFPDGRAFGYIAYPDYEDGSPSYNGGYIFQDGRMYPARAVKIPFMTTAIPEGEDVTLELESELGITRIRALSTHNTLRMGYPEMGGLSLNQGGARYEWDGQSAIGMMERSIMMPVQ